MKKGRKNKPKESMKMSRVLKDLKCWLITRALLEIKKKVGKNLKIIFK